MLQQTLAVFLVLGLLLTALWVVRRQGLATFNLLAMSKRIAWKNSQAKRLHVIDRIVLTPQHSLHLVSIDNRVVLISAYPNGCHALDPGSLKAAEETTDGSDRNAAAC